MIIKYYSGQWMCIKEIEEMKRKNYFFTTLCEKLSTDIYPHFYFFNFK